MRGNGFRWNEKPEGGGGKWGPSVMTGDVGYLRAELRANKMFSAALRAWHYIAQVACLKHLLTPDQKSSQCSEMSKIHICCKCLEKRPSSSVRCVLPTGEITTYWDLLLATNVFVRLLC